MTNRVLGSKYKIGNTVILAPTVEEIFKGFSGKKAEISSVFKATRGRVFYVACCEQNQLVICDEDISEKV